MKGTSDPAPEHQVSEQEVIAYFWGSLIHPDVEIRRIDPQTLLLLNRITGETLTIIAEVVQLKHIPHFSVPRGECPGCNWERINPLPVKLSVLKGSRD